MRLSTILRWEWCQALWADPEGRVWVWFTVLGWYLWLRYNTLSVTFPWSCISLVKLKLEFSFFLLPNTNGCQICLESMKVLLLCLEKWNKRISQEIEAKLFSLCFFLSSSESFFVSQWHYGNSYVMFWTFTLCSFLSQRFYCAFNGKRSHPALHVRTGSSAPMVWVQKPHWD